MKYIILFIGLMLTATMSHAETFKADVTKSLIVCDDKEQTETPERLLWFYFDDEGDVFISTNEFGDGIWLKVVRYFVTETQERFMAIASDRIAPGFITPPFGAGFVSVYGTIQHESIKGVIHTIFLDDVETAFIEFGFDVAQECFGRLKFRGVMND